MVYCPESNPRGKSPVAGRTAEPKNTTHDSPRPTPPTYKHDTDLDFPESTTLELLAPLYICDSTVLIFSYEAAKWTGGGLSLFGDRMIDWTQEGNTLFRFFQRSFLAMSPGTLCSIRAATRRRPDGEESSTLLHETTRVKVWATSCLRDPPALSPCPAGELAKIEPGSSKWHPASKVMADLGDRGEYTIQTALRRALNSWGVGPVLMDNHWITGPLQYARSDFGIFPPKSTNHFLLVPTIETSLTCLLLTYIPKGENEQSLHFFGRHLEAHDTMPFNVMTNAQHIPELPSGMKRAIVTQMDFFPGGCAHFSTPSLSPQSQGIGSSGDKSLTHVWAARCPSPELPSVDYDKLDYMEPGTLFWRPAAQVISTIAEDRLPLSLAITNALHNAGVDPKLFRNEFPPSPMSPLPSFPPFSPKTFQQQFDFSVWRSSPKALSPDPSTPTNGGRPGAGTQGPHTLIREGTKAQRTDHPSSSHPLMLTAPASTPGPRTTITPIDDDEEITKFSIILLKGFHTLLHRDYRDVAFSGLHANVTSEHMIRRGSLEEYNTAIDLVSKHTSIKPDSSDFFVIDEFMTPTTRIFFLPVISPFIIIWSAKPSFDEPAEFVCPSVLHRVEQPVSPDFLDNIHLIQRLMGDPSLEYRNFMGKCATCSSFGADDSTCTVCQLPRTPSWNETAIFAGSS